jgi:hypothetical protein
MTDTPTDRYAARATFRHAGGVTLPRAAIRIATRTDTTNVVGLGFPLETLSATVVRNASMG